MVYITLDCVGLTQSSVIQIIHCNVGLKHFFHLLKFLLLSLVFAYILLILLTVTMIIYKLDLSSFMAFEVNIVEKSTSLVIPAYSGAA